MLTVLVSFVLCTAAGVKTTLLMRSDLHLRVLTAMSVFVSDKMVVGDSKKDKNMQRDTVIIERERRDRDIRERERRDEERDREIERSLEAEGRRRNEQGENATVIT